MHRTSTAKTAKNLFDLAFWVLALAIACSLVALLVLVDARSLACGGM